jgi:hypothetical protein
MVFLSVKFNAPTTHLPIDHKELLNSGKHLHSEIDVVVDGYNIAVSGFNGLSDKLISIINLFNNRIEEVKNIPAIPSESIIIQNEGQTVIDLKSSYVMGINMLYVFVNGIYQHVNQDYGELSTTQIEFPKDVLKVGDVVEVRYVTSDNINLGDIKVVATISDLNNLQVSDNTLAVVIYDKKFYIYNNGKWGSLFEVDFINSLGLYFLYERQQITDYTKQTYTLNNITYSPDTHSLMVFVDGVKLSEDKYTEIDKKTIYFNTPFTNEKEIEFLVVNTDLWEETFSHSVQYEYDLDIYGKKRIVGENIKDTNSNTVKYTNYVYDDNNNIIYEIISKGSKTIKKEYLYSNDGDISEIVVTVQ